MGDFCDSQAYKDNPLFQVDKSALQIQLYYDDVEAVNPLGSNKKCTSLVSTYIAVYTLFAQN